MSLAEPRVGRREELYEIDVRYDERIPTCDPDVTLSADVYLPVGENPAPALVTVLEYRKDLPGMGGMQRWFAERGYASVLAEVRGIGSSDGAPRPIHHPGEHDDVVAVVEWAAAQGWCTGDVGMWGLSDGGTKAMAGAMRHPAPLKAIIPMMNALDPERDALHPGGARGDWLRLASWSGGMLIQQLLPPLHNENSVLGQRRWLERLQLVEPFLLDNARLGPGDPAWRDRVLDPSAIRVPTLCVGGWRDAFPGQTIRAYELIDAPKRLLVGPWGHVMPDASSVEPIDFLSMALRWWDHWLRGIDNGIMDEPPALLYLQGRNPGWRGFDSWPPAGHVRIFATGTDKILGEAIPDTSSHDGAIARYEPDPTTGSLSGLQGLGLGELVPPQDQHDDDMRAASFTSEPMADDVLICGWPELTVQLSAADLRLQRLVVRLADVDPLGRSTFVTGAVMTPNEQKRGHSVVLEPTTYRVSAGNRLRVILSDSDFPRLVPLPDPSPISIAGIELALPTIPEGCGAPVGMPQNAAAKATEMPRHGTATITRDPVHDGVEVRIQGASPVLTTTRGHRLESMSDVRASVRRATPGGAVTTGRHVTVVRMANGETVTLTATLRCTQGALWAQGQATIDAMTIFSRTWEVPLDHGRQP